MLLAVSLLLGAAGCSDDVTTTPAASSPDPSTPASSPTGSTGPAPAAGAVVDSNVHAELINAAWKNDVDRARALIARGADVNHEDATEQSAYLIATSEGYLDLLELTFQHGADVRALDSYNGTGLIRAAERGHGRVVGRLLQAGVDVDHVNRLGWTALHEAIVLGNGSERYVDTVRLLVAGGSDLRLPPQRDGIAPVVHAENRGQTAVVRTLRAALDAPPPTNATASLLTAAASGDADGVALALRAGADLEARDASNRTALLLAAAADHLAVARLLVMLGADVDAIDAQQDTPWLVTGVTGSVPMGEVLLWGRPDLALRNRFGGISVIPASERGHVDYVRWVVRQGIDVNHVNNLGWTAMLEAVILGDGSAHYQEIVRILLAAGADRAIADRNGVTPLAHARSKGHDAIARALAGP
jgi:ankyrin repeat protein